MADFFVLVTELLFGSSEPDWKRMFDLRLKRRLAALLARLQGYRDYSPVFVPTGRERLTRLSEFITGPTNGDEDPPGRLLLGSVREGGLSVA